MKIGFPTVTMGLGCKTAHTFRLASYSPERLIKTTRQNLDCLLQTLRFSIEHQLLFFRIGSDIVPFASHPVCDVAWWEVFAAEFALMGDLINGAGMRISMHPGQFTIVNSPDETLFTATVRELEYHARLLDLLGLDSTHKVQIHVGGVYGDKVASLERFARRYADLPAHIKTRLVIENDDRLYSVADCLWLNQAVGVPIVFDNLHHALLNSGEAMPEACARTAATWGGKHGVPMVDYSAQAAGERPGKHAETLDPAAFAQFLDDLNGHEFDIMFELKDKEGSALAAQNVIQQRGA